MRDEGCEKKEQINADKGRERQRKAEKGRYGMRDAGCEKS